MARGMPREKNPNWGGGRFLASNGYVLVRVGTDHHLAHVNGCAYEHRVVAEKQIGRRLEPTEHVHHINGNRTDNRPENLQVVAGPAEHQLLHRTLDTGRRMPGEDNPLVQCECGCGERFLKFDSSGRPRKFISGHNPHDSATQREVLDLISKSFPMSTSELLSLTGKSRSSIAAALTRLSRRGVIRNIRYGLWEINADG